MAFAFGGNKVRKMAFVAADAVGRAAPTRSSRRGRAVESRARHGRGRGQAPASVHSRRERRWPDIHRQRAAQPGCSALKFATSRRATTAPRVDGSRTKCRGTADALSVIPLWTLHAARRGGARVGRRRAARSDTAAGRHRPLDLIRRHTGRTRPPAALLCWHDARDRHQRRRLAGHRARGARRSSGLADLRR